MKIDVTDLPDLRVAAVPHRGPYNEIGEAFRQLAQAAGRAGLFRPDAMMLGVYHDDPRTVPAEQLRSAAALSVSAESAVPAGLTEVHLPGGRFARVVHTGSYETLPESWRQFVDHELRATTHQRRAGPSLEIYRNTPETVPPEELITELYVPIA